MLHIPIFFFHPAASKYSYILCSLVRFASNFYLHIYFVMENVDWMSHWLVEIHLRRVKGSRPSNRLNLHYRNGINFKIRSFNTLHRCQWMKKFNIKCVFLVVVIGISSFFHFSCLFFQRPKKKILLFRHP